MLNQIVFGLMSTLAVIYSSVAIPTVLLLQVCGLLHLDSTKTPNLSGKIAIVTGANTGIGKATARKLAENGATVILACRSLERGNEAARDILAGLSQSQTCSSPSEGGPSSPTQVSVMELDLSDLRSVRAFVASFTKVHGRLDILVNNAGINGFLGPGSPKRTKQGVEIVFGSNFIGHFLLTTLLLDLLKASPDGRIVNLSSVMHHFGSKNITRTVTGEDETTGYDDSKLAMLLFTKELRRRLAGTRVLATAVNPGFVASDIWRGFQALPTFSRIWSFICYLFALTVDQAATVSLAAAAAPRAAAPPPRPPRASAALGDPAAAPPSPSPAAAKAAGGGEGGEPAVYLQPYWLPLGMPFPFEFIGPYAGPRPGRPTLPAEEPVQSAELWRQSHLICSRI